MLKTLDLLIGMVVVYLMLSFVLAAVREALEARLKSRARHLAYGIMQLLNSRSAAQHFYNHPLVAALWTPNKEMVRNLRMQTETYGSRQDDVPLPPADFSGFNAIGAVGRFFGAWINKPKEAALPSYIPARTFALGVIGMALEKASGTQFEDDGAPVPQAVKQATVSLDAVRTAVDDLANQGINWAQSLQLLINGGVEDFESAVRAVETWYDGTMDRVAGWYRRETSVILFWLGLLTAITLNVDSISLVKYLSTHDQALQNLVNVADSTISDSDIQQRVNELRIRREMLGTPAQAAAAAASAAAEPSASPDAALQAIRAADGRVQDAKSQFMELGLPIGWSMAKVRAIFDPLDNSSPAANFTLTFIGWFITAIALSLGAPFWFDVLNKIMVIRSTVKPSEKSKDEGSEDRQPKAVIRVESGA